MREKPIRRQSERRRQFADMATPVYEGPALFEQEKEERRNIYICVFFFTRTALFTHIKEGRKEVHARDWGKMLIKYKLLSSFIYRATESVSKVYSKQEFTESFLLLEREVYALRWTWQLHSQVIMR